MSLYLHPLAIQFPSYANEQVLQGVHLPPNANGIEARTENPTKRTFFCRNDLLSRQLGNSSSLEMKLSTYTIGIFRRISEQKYRHTEMAIPAIKF